MDDTPAANAGLRSGDTIIAVDGSDLTPATPPVPGRCAAAPGTSVKLKVVREGAQTVRRHPQARHHPA